MRFCVRSAGVIERIMSRGRRGRRIRLLRCFIHVWIVGISGIKIDLYIYGNNNHILD